MRVWDKKMKKERICVWKESEKKREGGSVCMCVCVKERERKRKKKVCVRRGTISLRIGKGRFFFSDVT